MNIEDVLAKSPTQAAHADMHPQTDALPRRQFTVERLGDEFRDFFAIEHWWVVSELGPVLLPAAFHTIR